MITMTNSLAKFGHILYISSVDVSIGNGPGVNEREFTLSLYQAIGERAHFLIPQPQNEVHDLPASVCTFSAPHRSHHPKDFPSHVISTMRLADQILSRRRFDLIVFRLDILPFAPRYISWRHRIPFAIKTLGQGQLLVLGEKIGSPLGPLMAGLSRSMVKGLVNDALVTDTVSAEQHRYLVETLAANPNKIICLENAVNTERFSPTSLDEARKELGLEQYDPIVGYIGNHAAHERGGAQIINAAPMLLEKFPRLGLVLLGDMQGDRQIPELARSLGVLDHCVFTGYVPFQKVPIFVNALNVGVSLLAPRYTGQSELKVRQYVACGKPVIATIPGTNDFIARENLGSLVPYDEPLRLAEELERWLSLTETDRLAFSAHASQYAREHLSIEKALAERMEVWGSRLAQQSASAPAIDPHNQTDWQPTKKAIAADDS